MVRRHRTGYTSSFFSDLQSWTVGQGNSLASSVIFPSVQATFKYSRGTTFLANRAMDSSVIDPQVKLMFSDFSLQFVATSFMDASVITPSK